MAHLIAAIDQGTTSTRCLLIDSAGAIVSSAQAEHEQIMPTPGYVEHDPAEIWLRTRQVIGEALSNADTTAGDIAALGITNQRETTVFWHRRTGEPLCHAIVWQDTRTASLCEELSREGGADRFRERTGLPIATYFAGPKMRWALEHVPAVRQAAASGDLLVGTLDTWLIWNLTGGVDGGLHITDPTNASRTLLMDLASLDWHDELLNAIGVDRACLPRIVRSAAPDSFGLTRAAGPLGAEVPIAGVLGDQQAALVGQCCFEPGAMKNTYGTGCFLLAHTGPTPVPSTSGLLTTVAYSLPDSPPAYALEGSVAVAGALVQWLRDNLKIIDRAPQIEALAAEVSDTAGVHIVPAFSGLFAPYWRSDARGIVTGLTRMAHRGHLARAALEAVCFQNCDLVDAITADTAAAPTELRVDGGMVVNNLLMQLQADLLGIPVVRPVVTETTGLGAAYAAGLATGFFATREELAGHARVDRTFEPALGEDERRSRRAAWAQAVERSFNQA